MEVSKHAGGPLHANAVCVLHMAFDFIRRKVPSANGGVFRAPPLFSLFWSSPTPRRPRSGGLLNIYLFLSVSFTVIPILPSQRHQQCGRILLKWKKKSNAKFASNSLYITARLQTWHIT